MVIGRESVTVALPGPRVPRYPRAPVTSEKGSTTSIDDPDAIAVTIREAAERNTKALRERPVPIALEPPTVFRP
jgi:hypothetical protein